MTPTLAEADVIRPPAEVVLDAWHVYRRAQQIPFPADPGDLMKAQSRLFSQVQAFTATCSSPSAGPDTAAIEDAIDALVAAVEWHCGQDAAAHVSGRQS